MDSGPVETAPDRRGSTRSLATPVSPIETHREGFPAATMSSEAPVSATVTTATVEQTNGNTTEMPSPKPLRVGEYISGNHQISQLSPVSGSGQCASRYELEATVASKTVAANENFTAYHPSSVSQVSTVRSCLVRDSRSGGAYRRLRTSATPPLLFRTTTPATALHYSSTSDANKRRSTDKGSESDPFLGTGRPMDLIPSSPGPMTGAATIETPSPTIARLRGSQHEGTPGLLDLHDTQGEILLLLKQLEDAHRAHTNNEVEAALERCQVDLRARSKDKAIGTAEGNILDREAARIGRVGGTPTRPGRETRDAALLRELRHQLARLVLDARAAIDTAAQAKSQAGSSSDSRETKGYIPYRVSDDARVASLNAENLELKSEVQELKKQVDQLQAEKDLARKEKSDLFSKVDMLTEEIKGYRRDAPWEKVWNVGHRKSG